MATGTDSKRSGVITARQVEAASTRAKASGKDVWLSDPAARGAGRMLVRCRPSGARLISYRYTTSDGRRDTLAIGAYDATGRDGFDLTEARARVGELLRLHQSGVGDLRAHLDEKDQAERDRRAAEREAAERAKRDRERGSLRALIDAYVGTLAGRVSAYDVRNITKLHVIDAFPEIAVMPAAAVKAEQLRDVLARLIEDGKGRTAAKLRAYLRAAYGLAMRASLDPTVPTAFGAFGIEANPLERLPSLAQYSRALDRALTLPELAAFWKRLKELPVPPASDAVIAAVLLGGQRPAQLVRITSADVDLTAKTVTIRDIKGRNRAVNPRRHVVPIVQELLPILSARRASCSCPEAPLFSSTGRVQLREETAAEIVREICSAMQAAGELEAGVFCLRDLRRTAETHLAALGVSRDVRAQLQSHGLGGVQARHYDRHDYQAEKLAALESWVRRLEGKPAPVVALTGRQRKAAA
jgi:integrase